MVRRDLERGLSSPACYVLGHERGRLRRACQIRHLAVYPCIHASKSSTSHGMAIVASHVSHTSPLGPTYAVSYSPLKKIKHRRLGSVLPENIAIDPPTESNRMRSEPCCRGLFSILDVFTKTSGTPRPKRGGFWPPASSISFLGGHTMLTLKAEFINLDSP